MHFNIKNFANAAEAHENARAGRIIECLYLKAGATSPSWKRYRIRRNGLNQYDNFVCFDIDNDNDIKTPKWSRMSEVTIKL